MKAYLILEDGNVFEGESVGADKEVVSEFVFNTSMTGYVEVLTISCYDISIDWKLWSMFRRSRIYKTLC